LYTIHMIHYTCTLHLYTTLVHYTCTLYMVHYTCTLYIGDNVFTSLIVMKSICGIPGS